MPILKDGFAYPLGTFADNLRHTPVLRKEDHVYRILRQKFRPPSGGPCWRSVFKHPLTDMALLTEGACISCEGSISMVLLAEDPSRAQSVKFSSYLFRCSKPKDERGDFIPVA